MKFLLHGLRGYPIGIVSGLALGIDGLAHEAALENGLYTLAVPGSGLDERVLYPARHKPLMRRILAAGGGTLSELAPRVAAARWTFPARNRIMVGLSQAVLMIEAEEKSGTLITARLAADYNRELLVVPGSIFASHSAGTHQFLKLGATPVTTPEDILEALRIEKSDASHEAGSTLPLLNLSPLENQVLDFLKEPRQRDEIIQHLALPSAEVAITLTELELQDLIVITALGYRRR